MKNLPLVTVDTRTYNSEKTLEKTLQSIKNQTYPNIEILVSDGFSKDRSVEIAKKYGAKVNFADKLGDARIQNFKLSKGKYIISVDSDQVLDKGVIKKCVEMSEKENLDAITISEKSLITKNTFLERLIAYDKWVVDQTQDDDVMFGTACPRFFRISSLKKIKWNPGLAVFDDTILYQQLLEKGGKFGYLATQSIHHHEVTDWVTFVRKFHRYGKGYIRSFKRKPGTIASRSLPRKSYFSKAALRKPHYFGALLILYAVKSVAALTGVISYMITPKNDFKK